MAEPRPEDPLGRGATARLLAEHGVHPRKELGQHFLVDPNLVRRIVAVSGVGPGDRVLEIGAGAGTLTRGLAAAGARVLAYEIDRRLRPVLEAALAGVAGVEVRYEDASGLDPEGLGEGPWVMVANLPYNVGTPLLLRLLREAPAITRFVVMLQREAVERLAAAPGSRVYGLPSVVVRLHGTVGVAFRVPATVFLPPPRVESAVAVIRSPAGVSPGGAGGGAGRGGLRAAAQDAAPLAGRGPAGCPGGAGRRRHRAHPAGRGALAGGLPSPGGGGRCALRPSPR